MTTTDTNWFAFTTGLLLLGFLLIVAEIFFFPGFGVPGIAGLCLILLSIYAASIGLQGEGVWDRLIPDGNEEWSHFTDWWVLFLGVHGRRDPRGALPHALPPQDPFLSRAFLTPPILAAAGDGPSGHATPGATSDRGIVSISAGSEGTTETPLRPSGACASRRGSSA